MRKIIATATALAALAVAAPASAGTCNVKCLGRQVKALNHEVNALLKIDQCFTETPLTVYGDQGGTFGYTFDDGTGNVFDTTALDMTNSGDTVGTWALSDGCNTSSTPNVAHAQARVTRHGSPIAPIVLLPSIPRKPTR